MYAESFGLQWRQFARTQLDSYTGIPISRERARHCIGPEQFSCLKDIEILEVGCGAGRFTEVLLNQGARVLSCDITAAAFVNAQNFPPDPKHQVIQADVTALPFPDVQQFDLVFCLGVIQHTPDPEDTIAKLYDRVRPGGLLVIDHYKFNLATLTRTAWMFREIFRRLNAANGLRCTDALVRLLLPLHKRIGNRPRLQWLARRFSPIACYYHIYPELPEPLQQEWARLDTHDALTDYFKHTRTTSQINLTLRSLGASDVAVWTGGNGVEARCRKPTTSAARR